MFFNLGLIGYPLGHSLSPKIHAAALQACGLQGSYSLFPVPPEDFDGLAALLDRLRSGDLHGLNVTIPHKQNVIPLLDALTPAAQAIGAVNTIWMQNGLLTGDNTDAPGFLADLNRRLAPINTMPQIRNRKSKIANPKSALVLGAGGSARAVVYALLNDRWEVTIAARRLEQAEGLIARYAHSPLYGQLRITHYALSFTDDASRFTPYPLSSLPEVTLIVNTTPVGMAPNIHHSPWPANVPFPPHAAVYDLVYNPSETQLVKDARAAGLRAVTGLGMLVEQAALSFEIWTGCRPERDRLSPLPHLLTAH